MTESPSVMTSPPPAHRTPEYHEHIPSGAFDSRSPCPALNTLANHGYLPRNGKNIRFFELIHALQYVYNITWLLAFFLTSVGFITSGKVTFVKRKPSSSGSWLSKNLGLVPLPQWTLQLSALSVRGSKKLAHDASLVHPNKIPSHAPDKTLLGKLLAFASPYHGKCRLRGLSLVDLARYHDKRESELSRPLSGFHKKVALGEVGLAWAVMRRRCSTEPEGSGERAEEKQEVITEDALRKWLGTERLPDNWWGEGGLRPVQPIGLFEAKRRASDVAALIEK